MTLTNFNNLYSYKYDAFGRDSWRVLRLDELGQYQGDCEDYALSVLFYHRCLKVHRILCFQLNSRKGVLEAGDFI